MNPTPFIVAAYAVFFVVLAVDLAAPLLGRRRALERIRAQLKRAKTRGRE
jgi:heme exporter protein CcmD